MHHFGTVRRHLDQLLWALLPGVCILCDANSRTAADLCEHCRDALPRLSAPCRSCALPVSSVADTLCDACRSRAPPYSRTVAALRYAGPVTRMIHRLKFRGSRIDARVLGKPARIRDRRCICRSAAAGPDRAGAAQPPTPRATRSQPGGAARSMARRAVRSQGVRTRSRHAAASRSQSNAPIAQSHRRVRDRPALRRSVRRRGRRRHDYRQHRRRAVSNAARRRRERSSRVGRRENAARRRANLRC